MRRRRRAAVRVVLVLVAASGLVRSGPAEAQDAAPETTLGGYQGSAAASGLRALYNPSGLLPIAAPVDLGAPDALATVNSGPTTFARASVADPGDLLANPAAVLGLADPSLSGSLPQYPYRVSVTSGLGQPTAEVSPAPGLNARVKADDTGSSAVATMPALEAPAALSVGTMAASASVTVTDAAVTVHARTSLGGVDLLGLLKVDAIVTDLTATSGTGPPTLTGGTRITGASLAGQPVTIDADGIHAGNGSGGANALVDQLDHVLAQVGIRVWLAQPIDLAGGTSGQLTAAGLRIDVEVSPRTYPSLGQLLDALPPMDALVPGLPSVDDLLAAVRARHLANVQVGGASVALTTTHVAAIPEPPSVPSSPAGDLPSAAVATGGGFTLDPIATPVVTASPGRVVPTSHRTSVGFGEGVGGLALVLLLLQPLLGDRLARWATTLLAADGATTCPREGPP